MNPINIENTFTPELVPTGISTRSGPSAEVPVKSVAIHLVTSAEMTNCPFWLGFYKKGTLTPPEILDSPSLVEAFNRAATDGLGENAPIMLSDSACQPARYIYLLPYTQSIDDRWLWDLLETVHAWASPKIGIYLSPDLLQADAAESITRRVIEKLISECAATDYFLMPGQHGINMALNTALEIRNALDLKSIKVYVFH